MKDGTTPSPARKGSRALLTACVMAATLMQTLDTTIVNVALPYMRGSLAATPEQINWVLTSYIAAAAIMTPPIGWLSSRLGRRNLFIGSLAGFTVMSVLCGLSGSLGEIVLFRLLQGAFGAALVPLSQATILDIYPLEERGSAMALWGIGVVIGPILGPTLGGYLTDYYDWRWVFFINVPIGIATVVGLWLFLRDEPRSAPVRFDGLGFAILAIALGSFQLLLDRGEQQDWFGAYEIIIYAVLAGLSAYLFVVHMLTARQPLITPAMLADRNFAVGLVLIFGVGGLIVATAALMAPWLQSLGGYSVSQAGLLIAPRGIGTMAGILIAGRLTNRIDLRVMMFAGLLLAAWSYWLMSGWTPDIDVWTLSLVSAVQGFGLGLLFTALGVIAFYTLSAEFRTEGSAVFSLMRNLGSAIGISMTSVVLAQDSQIVHSSLIEAITPFNRALQSGGAYLLWNTTSPGGLMALEAEISRQAAIIAYANDFLLLFWVAIAMAPLLLVMRQPRRPAASRCRLQNRARSSRRSKAGPTAASRKERCRPPTDSVPMRPPCRSATSSRTDADGPDLTSQPPCRRWCGWPPHHAWCGGWRDRQ
jgi:DHA2 family multidrug resistance protein